MSRVSRYTLKPIDPAYRREWEAYKRQLSCFWTVEEVDLSGDIAHWHTALNDDERHFVTVVLAFFAASDGIVGENLVENFMLAFDAPEVRCFYAFQTAMENIHAEMYANLIEGLIADSTERERIFNSIHDMPCVASKAAWALRWLESKDASLGERLVAFAAVEGIFFSCSFCAIFWLRQRKIMPGLCMSNEFISRDEGMHTEFACMLVERMEEGKPSVDTITAIITSAVEVERQFVRDALRCDLVGINATLMEQYLECVADNLLVDLGAPRHYGTANPFDWMEMISIQGKTNFFERRVSEYQRAKITGGLVETDDF